MFARPKIQHLGTMIAFGLYLTWLGFLLLLLQSNWNASHWFLIIPAILLQTHLFTGLFITAHDAMHGTISSNKVLNNGIGWLCSISYAVFPFSSLYKKHHMHHDFVGEHKDPDVHPKKFWPWYFTFVLQYFTWWQLLVLAIIFNILQIFFSQQNLLLFWVLPSLLSTLQLFYFGTYIPHKNQPANKHRSNMQEKNHLWAFLTCYFFGYHYEHHDKPGIPWWQLWREKG